MGPTDTYPSGPLSLTSTPADSSVWKDGVDPRGTYPSGPLRLTSTPADSSVWEEGVGPIATATCRGVHPLPSRMLGEAPAFSKVFITAS